jgi:hypothetical protein
LEVSVAGGTHSEEKRVLDRGTDKGDELSLTTDPAFDPMVREKMALVVVRAREGLMNLMDFAP